MVKGFSLHTRPTQWFCYLQLSIYLPTYTFYSISKSSQNCCSNNTNLLPTCSINPKRCGLFGQLRRRGGVQNDPLRDSGLWMLQFLSQLNKQCLIWKLTSLAKIWDLSEVTEAHSLASEHFRSERGQNEKNLRRKS